jgi:hypothetical protein
MKYERYRGSEVKMRRYMKRFLTLLLTASMIMGSFGMDAASAAYGADAVNAAANISETEESSTGADRSLPSFSDLYIGENAISFEYATGETERMASDLGYDMALQQKKENVSSEKKIISRFFALGAEEPKPDYEFADMYYLYDTATSTATNENLTGDASDAAQTVKMQMEIAANVQYDPGTLEIRIPSSLYTYRDGNTTAYFSDLGVPKAPKTNKNTAFNYMLKNIDGKEYIVLKNAKTLLEGSSNMIQIFYSLNDMQTVDQTSWSWTPEIYVDGVKDADGTTLTGIMDTSTSLSKTKKNGFILSGSLIYPELYTVKQIDNWLVKCGTSFENTGSKLDDYRYVLWRTDIAGSDSQPWTLSVKDTPASGGIVLGQCVTDIYNNVLAKSGTASDGTLTWANQQSYNLGKAAYIYSVTAYPLTSWPDDNKVSNTISVTVTGTDDKVDHTLSSSSDWVWEKYEWTYVGDGCTGIRT